MHQIPQDPPKKLVMCNVYLFMLITSCVLPLLLGIDDKMTDLDNMTSCHHQPTADIPTYIIKPCICIQDNNLNLNELLIQITY